jgi:hypothetical protein
MAWTWIDTGANLVEWPDQPQPLTLIGAIIPVAALILPAGLSYFLLGDGGAVGPNPVSGRSRFHRCTVASRWFIDGRSRSSFQEHGKRGAP